MSNKIRRALCENESYTIRSWEEFDRVPFVKLREQWLFYNAGCIDEMLERVDSFLEIDDFVTVCLLLDRLCTHRGDRRSEITQAIIYSVRRAVKLGRSNAMGATLEILCRRINFDRKPYGENVGEFFQEFFEKYYTFSRLRLLGEEGAKWMSMILLNIGHAGDKSFVPILEELSFDNERIAHFFEYTSVCQEMLKMEGLRLLVLQHLKGI